VQSLVTRQVGILRIDPYTGCAETSAVTGSRLLWSAVCVIYRVLYARTSGRGRLRRWLL